MVNLSPTVLARAGVTVLRRQALISASGQDASAFLHGQLTNDIEGLSADRSCLAGYCSPKGRLLATMLVWRDNESVMLLLPQELQQEIQKRLQMFVLRAKVQFENLTSKIGMLGIVGPNAASGLANWFPVLPAQPFSVVRTAAGSLLRLADAEGVARYQWNGPAEIIETAMPVLHAELGALSEQDWELLEIHSAIPFITSATKEKFVPQMINFELVGGVNFKKGCYPGQEIVARTHYLGKQKRRTVLASIDDASVTAGVEVFSSDDPDQPCGTVVNAVANHHGGCDCLIEIKTALLHQAPVRLGNGALCQWLSMPYALPDDVNTPHTAP